MLWWANIDILVVWLPIAMSDGVWRVHVRPDNGRIYYGWVMLLVVSLNQIVSWGILYYSFRMFVTPMAIRLGWETSSLTAGYALVLLCSGLAAVPVGRWLDRHGTRALMTAGLCAAALSLVARASVRELGVFLLILAAIGTVMAAVDTCRRDRVGLVGLTQIRSVES